MRLLAARTRAWRVRVVFAASGSTWTRALCSTGRAGAGPVADAGGGRRVAARDDRGGEQINDGKSRLREARARRSLSIVSKPLYDSAARAPAAATLYKLVPSLTPLALRRPYARAHANGGGLRCGSASRRTARAVARAMAPPAARSRTTIAPSETSAMLSRVRQSASTYAPIGAGFVVVVATTRAATTKP